MSVEQGSIDPSTISGTEMALFYGLTSDPGLEFIITNTIITEIRVQRILGEAAPNNETAEEFWERRSNAYEVVAATPVPKDFNIRLEMANFYAQQEDEAIAAQAGLTEQT